MWNCNDNFWTCTVVGTKIELFESKFDIIYFVYSGSSAGLVHR